MKKIASFLALVIVFCSLVGCSNFGSQNKKAEDGIWSVQKTTDEFGDVTADSQDFISASVQGSYENEEVENSQLNISVNFRKRSDFNHYIIEFQLTENNTTKIQFKENSYKQLKTKVGEEIQEFYLSLEESSGKLSHGDGVFYEIDYGGDYVFSNLYNGKDVKCVIEIDDSAVYSFELKSDNFKALCDANSFTEGAGDITVKESVNFLVQDKGIMIDESCDCLINNYETFELVETEELKELLNCKFLMITLEDFDKDFCPWKLKEYSAKENTCEELARYYFSERESREHYGEWLPKYRNGFHGYEGCRDYSGCSGKLDMEIEDNLVKRDTSYKQEIRKITDNIFISTIYESYIGIAEGKGWTYITENYYYILIKCDGSFVDTVEYAQENYVEEIPY